MMTIQFRSASSLGRTLVRNSPSTEALAKTLHRTNSIDGGTSDFSALLVVIEVAVSCGPQFSCSTLGM